MYEGSKSGRIVLKLIKDIALEKKTVVVVTHNAPIAEMAQRVIHMKDGKIYEISENKTPKNVEDIVW